MDHGKLERILTLFKYLTFNRNKTVKDLAAMLGTGVKTIYRYFETFKEVGFGLSTDYGTVYRITSFPKEFMQLGEGFQMVKNGGTACALALPEEEYSTEGKTYEILQEYKENSAYTKVPYLKRFSENALKLLEASKEKKVVILHGYESNRRNRVCVRKVEPFDFCWYFNWLWAYDLELKQNVLFRVTQIGEVEITGEEWKEAKRHKRQSFDVFGYNGHQTQHVRLRLSMRAKNRLLDQYPMSIRAVSQINGCSEWYFDARLCSYRAVARFYQAFCGEVEILEGEGLEDYAIECMEKQLQIAKAKRDMKRLAETPTPETQHTV